VSDEPNDIPNDVPNDTPNAAGRPGVSRRAALKVLGLAAAGGVTAGATACGPDTPAVGAGRTAAAGATGAAAPNGAAAPPFFTPHERETVTVLVDYVIPRDARSGSATDAGVPAWMDAFLADADTEDGFRARIRGGLAWLDAECDRRFGAPAGVAAGAAAGATPAAVTFVRASDAQRRQVLDDIAYPGRARPAMSHGVAFFNAFRDFTASGFFSSRVGYEDLRYMGNVAVPVWNGCPPEITARLGVSDAVMATRVPPQEGGRRA